MSTTYADLRLTRFPEGVDTFEQMLDIISSDAVALKNYQTAMENGNIEAANAALATMSNATQKILTADKINKIYDALEALERFLGTDIETYVENLQTNWQNEIDKFSYKGIYNSSTNYVKNNMVAYTTGGFTYIYICIAACRGANPATATNYWKQLTIRGLKGDSGTGMAFLFEWNAQTSYSVGDSVTYDNKVWACKTANSNSAPSSSNTKWTLLMSLETMKYPVQSNEPTYLTNGELWFQVV